MSVWPWLMTSPLCSSVSQSAKRLLWISQLVSDFINNTSPEADYGRHGASQRAANCKRVMKTQFRLGGRAFFSPTIGLWIHRRGQHNPTSAMFMIKPGDPQPLWLWYILTDQVNRLGTLGVNLSYYKTFGDKEMIPRLQTHTANQ